MNKVVVAGVSTKDYAKLLPFVSVPEFDPLCWNEGELRRCGLALLLNEAEIAPAAEDQIDEIRISVDKVPSTIGDYIDQFFQELHRQTEALETAEAVLVLDFLPFFLSRTRLDKIATDLFSREFFRGFHDVVFLLRNADWLIQIRDWVPTMPRIWVVDLRGYVASLTPTRVERPCPISRKSFRLLLRTDRSTIYKSLIYETNCYIGHFILPFTHVRTTYYLADYIRRDNVWEFMYEALLALVSGSTRALVIGVGFEHAAIVRVGEQFQASVQAVLGDVTLHFVPAFDGRTPSEMIPTDWSQNFDLAIVVTDIVNTGGTVDPWVTRLKETAPDRTVKVFSIAKMKNSPQRISGIDLVAGVEVQRNYYLPPNDCILCKIHQPSVKVDKADDFRIVSAQQMTPYDFWEMIKETKALRINDVDAHGKPLPYRIDTTEITRRYGGWLINVIKARWDDRFPRMKADLIFTVDEVWGQAFADLVRRALDLPKIVSIARPQLQRTSASGLPTETTPPFERRSRVLLVDDGINNGETLRKMISFCQVADAEILGALVFLNRLDEERTKRIERLMGNRSVLSLYTWPFPQV